MPTTSLHPRASIRDVVTTGRASVRTGPGSATGRSESSIERRAIVCDMHRRGAKSTTFNIALAVNVADAVLSTPQPQLVTFADNSLLIGGAGEASCIMTRVGAR